MQCIFERRCPLGDRGRYPGNRDFLEGSRRSSSRGRGDWEGDRGRYPGNRDFLEGSRRSSSRGRGDWEGDRGRYPGNRDFVEGSRRSSSRGRGDWEGDRNKREEGLYFMEENRLEREFDQVVETARQTAVQKTKDRPSSRSNKPPKLQKS